MRPRQIAALVACCLVLLGPSLPALAQAPRAVLKTNLVRGYVEVFLNRHRIGRFGKASALASGGVQDRDVTSLLQGGRNQLRCVWSERTYPLGDVHVSLGDHQGQYRKVAAMNFGVTSKARGSQSAAFDVPRAGAARPGSQAGQTLMTANLTRGRVSVLINGRKVGDYVQGVVPLDVTPYVHSGSNTVRVTFGKPRPVGSLSLAHAAQRNQFRTIWSQTFDVFAAAPQGTLTFQLP